MISKLSLAHTETKQANSAFLHDFTAQRQIGSYIILGSQFSCPMVCGVELSSGILNSPPSIPRGGR